jgi:hypothetical protein
MAPLLPLAAYERILVALSGGKDSIACLLALLEAGANPARIELHDHEVDGRGPSFIRTGRVARPTAGRSPPHGSTRGAAMARVTPGCAFPKSRPTCRFDGARPRSRSA